MSSHKYCPLCYAMLTRNRCSACRYSPILSQREPLTKKEMLNARMTRYQAQVKYYQKKVDSILKQLENEE